MKGAPATPVPLPEVNLADRPFAYPLSRRGLIRSGALGAAALFAPSGFAKDAKQASATPALAPGETESHGLSTFGDLALPADFTQFGYVRADAPKGGQLTLTTQASTYDSLNGFILRGTPAQGVSIIFDSLLTASLDERDAYYGLVARAVRVSPDKLTYRFLLRKEARFHDGSPLTAEDCAFSLNILKSKGHPIIAQMLRDLVSAEPEADDVLVVKLAPSRTRDLPLVIAGQPIFSKAYYANRAFDETTLEPPLGSGAYKIGAFEQGRFNGFDRVADYWGKDLPVNVGQNNFDHIKFEYFGDSNVAFEGFKAGAYTLRVEDTARLWATGYDFPAVREKRVLKETFQNNRIPGIQGWCFNTRRPMFKDARIREALGYAFDFQWASHNLMYDAYKRVTSYFENSDLAATGEPDAAELALLEPFRAELSPQVFGPAPMPPVSDGSGQDRNLLRKANELLLAAGCVRKGEKLFLPDGKPLEFEFLDRYNLFERITLPFIKNLKLLGVTATFRVIDSAQYKQRMETFDFDVTVDNMLMSHSPGEELRNYFGSEAATFNGSRNLAGVSSKAIDALIDKALKVETRAELVTVCRALDRVLRAGHYTLFHYYTPVDRIAHWDVFGRPDQPPKYEVGYTSTWWWDEEKAKKINFAGR
ncbi:extracellular solute-binding protein [Methylocystis iwaonis]|uniref:ABC transporter substrate-binding protein n=1 Tax=Methylocystis iwaonis TaxID=2885079 RepID=A0ABM8E9X8_9HYPH|nr:extracellular solute-binding protein [Methylocystis iwaonis]BDV34707.1 ABC transporter substrate-binding protein [Methylocystis iwaonis]